MTLSPPTILGPISPCSSHVFVANQLIGARVEILQSRSDELRLVRKAVFTATSAGQWIPVDEPLDENEVVVAIQSLATGEKSDLPEPSPDARPIDYILDLMEYGVQVTKRPTVAEYLTPIVWHFSLGVFALLAN
jgi:hypothetical protein